MREIFNRRSIRRFKDQPVEKDKIDRLLRAAMQAPSAHNQQPWEFIVVENKETLAKLPLTSPYSKPAGGSAVTFVLLGNGNNIVVPTAWQQDMGAAVQNILLEATHLGLGAVWIGVATSDAGVKYVKDLFQLPDYLNPFALVSIGYPDVQTNEFVDRYKSDKVHYESWQQAGNSTGNT